MLAKRTVEQLRNVGFIGHGGTGKTSLAEAMLYTAGATDRLGRTGDGTTVMDYDPEEIKRQISINTSLAPLEWQGARVNLVDAPGYLDFIGEVRAALRVVEAAVVVVDAVAGVEVGTELHWRVADEYHLPRMVFVNRLDRENASFEKALATLEEVFGNRLVPLVIPVGAEAGLKGVVDLRAEAAHLYAGDASGKWEEAPVPDELSAAVAKARERLLEAAAECDDSLLEKYLEGEALTPGEVTAGLRQGVLAGTLVPVLCGSALKNVGTRELLDAVVEIFPSPADAGAVSGRHPRTGEPEQRRPAEDEAFSALVFKTMADPYVGKLTLFRVYSGLLRSNSDVYNATRDRTERIGQLYLVKGKHQEPVAAVAAGDLAAVAKLQETTTGDTLSDAARPVVLPPVQFPAPAYSMAIVPRSKGDEEKISAGLARLTEEDPTFRVRREAATHQTLISGMGELHLEVITDRLKRKFGVEVNLEPPRVPYRETIRSSARAEGKYKKQTGGRGQYGHVWIELEPLGDGQEFEFVDKIYGGVVPQQYRPAVEKGIREAMQEGVLAGYPVTGVRATLVDGSYHTVDSSEMAFKIAGSLAFKKGAGEAHPVLLEPIVRVEVRVPEQFMGDIMADLNKKRGKILGMEPEGRLQLIRALVPLAEMFQYAIDLRSITQGRGAYTMEFVGYEEVPAHIAQQIISQAKRDQ